MNDAGIQESISGLLHATAVAQAAIAANRPKEIPRIVSDLLDAKAGAIAATIPNRPRPSPTRPRPPVR